MKYRYLVGVGVNGVNNKNPGEKYLDFFCEYTDELIKQATMEQIINYSWSNEMGKKPDNPAMHELNGIRRIAVGRKLAHGLLVCLFNYSFIPRYNCLIICFPGLSIINCGNFNFNSAFRFYYIF